MFTLQKLLTIYNILLSTEQIDFKKYARTYMFLENSADIISLQQQLWDKKFENATPFQQEINVMLKNEANNYSELNFKVWDLAAEILKFRYLNFLR